MPFFTKLLSKNNRCTLGKTPDQLINSKLGNLTALTATITCSKQHLETPKPLTKFCNRKFSTFKNLVKICNRLVKKVKNVFSDETQGSKI